MDLLKLNAIRCTKTESSQFLSKLTQNNFNRNQAPVGKQISALKYKNREIGKGKKMSIVGLFAEFGTPK